MLLISHFQAQISILVIIFTCSLICFFLQAYRSNNYTANEINEVRFAKKHSQSKSIDTPYKDKQSSNMSNSTKIITN